jgi:hypothetical protein
MTAETETVLPGSVWLFPLAAVIFLGSAALVVYDLLQGNSLLRGLGANGVGTVLLAALAARNTLSDPDSHIGTRLDAFRAALLFCGVYLLVTGVLVVLAGVALSPDPRLAAPYLGVGGLVVVVTFLGGGESGVLDRLSTLAGLVGLLLVVGSAGLFVYDLVTGGDVMRGIAANGVGAALFILWSAYDMPGDPDSGVDTGGDALGIALLFYGTYLLVVGVTVVVTSVAHDQGLVGFLYLVLAVVPLVLGFVLTPLDSLGATDESVDGESSADGG